MSDSAKDITRRQFIKEGLCGAALIGLAGTISVAETGRIAAGSDRDPYDPIRLSNIDPSLVHYRESVTLNLEDSRIRAIGVGPGDELYVAADGQMHVFDRDLALISTSPLNGKPTCFTISEQMLYVGYQNRMEVYEHDGALKHHWEGMTGKGVFTSIAVVENDVFVADAGNRIVLKYDTTGRLIRSIGDRDPARGITGFSVPSPYFDVAIASDGLLRVANPGRHRVEAYTLDGELELTWGNADMSIEGFCGCCNPINFAMLSDGSLVTCEKGIPRVKVLGTDGELVSVVAGPEEFSQNAAVCEANGNFNCQAGGLDVAVDSSGRVFVMDPVMRQVRVFQKIL